jgi:hypothetical protein
MGPAELRWDDAAGLAAGSTWPGPAGAGGRTVQQHGAGVVVQQGVAIFTAARTTGYG